MHHVARIVVVAALLAVVPALAGCRTAGPTSAPDVPAFSAEFTPPAMLATGRVRLEPLGPRHAQLDYDAFMSSREHLQRTLHWGTWPSADMTVEQNRKDLARHEQEFRDREGYAYTVLRPDGTACVGCIYINPLEDDPDGAEFAYWVTETGVDEGLDAHLLDRVTAWFGTDWPFDTVRLPIHPDNPRGMEIASDAGMVRADRPESGHVVYVWRRD